MAADKLRGFLLFLCIFVFILALLRLAITAYLENEAINDPLAYSTFNYGPAQLRMFQLSLIAAVVTAAVCIMLFIHHRKWNEATRQGSLAAMLIMFAFNTLATGYAIKFLIRERDNSVENSRLSIALASFDLATTFLEIFLLLPIVGSYVRTQLNLINLATITSPMTSQPLLPVAGSSYHHPEPQPQPRQYHQAPPPHQQQEVQVVQVRRESRVVPPTSNSYCPFCANKYADNDYYCSLCGQSRSLATAAPRRTTVTRTEAGVCVMQ